MARFALPEYSEILWMVENNDMDQPYLKFMTDIHEMLCLYSMKHGLPQGISDSDKSRADYQNRLHGQIFSFELKPTKGQTLIAYRSLINKIEENKRTTLDLYNTFASKDAISPDVDEFLDTLLIAYTFVTLTVRTLRATRP